MTFDPATTYTEEAIRAATLAASIIATSSGPQLYAIPPAALPTLPPPPPTAAKGGTP